MRTSLRIAGAGLAALAAWPAFAAWPADPAINLPVCQAPRGQQFPVGAAAGAAAVVAWVDLRGGASFDVYAQRVLASGSVDPAWPVDGLAVCTANADQHYPAVVGDGADGVFVAWCDARGGGFDVYAQHVLASGAIDPAWPANGLSVCSAPGSQWFPSLASDGGSGFLVAWHDWRSGGIDVYAHHVLGSGAVDPAWPEDGLAVCTAPGNQEDVRLVGDGASGALVVWIDRRGGVNSDLYAQRLLPTGVVDPAWPADGLAVCTAPGNQLAPRVVSDGAAGAIVAWQDTRGGSEYDVYAHRVLASGAVDPAWPADGRAVCAEAGNQLEPDLVTDGAGGAIVVWTDYRDGDGSDVVAQRVLAGGALDPAWPAGGRVLCGAPEYQFAPDALSDGAGGALVAWTDARDGTDHDVYAQHVLAGGALDPAWPADGRAVSTAPGDQQNPVMIEVPGAGGTGWLPVVAWDDTRDGNFDIYAQPASPASPAGAVAPAIFSVLDAGPDQGGYVDVSWNASALDVAPAFGIADYRVWRSAPGSGWQVVGATAAATQPSYTLMVPTLADSTGDGVPVHVFVIEARGDTLVPSQHWFSAPDSGWSADDLAPAVPAGFTGTFAAGVATLAWDANAEPDLAGYRLYRHPWPGFTPEPENLLAATTDTTYADDAGGAYAYKLSAVDAHGNESGYADFMPASTAGTGAGAPARTFLEIAGGNPGRGPLALRFGLAAPGHATLSVYDTAGRRVRVLAGGAFTAGTHALAWDGRDGAGRAAAPGLYFVRLEAAGFAAARRVVRTE